jgi:hypothetical protein
MQLLETDESIVRTFAAEVVPGSLPLTVFCHPVAGAAERDCFGIVEKQIAKAGGLLVLGWAIWYRSPIIEAEFHAVWQSCSGLWLDLTPRPFDLEWITFVSDPAARYDGSQVDNVRKSLVDDPLVHEFLALQRRQFEIMNEGDLAHQHGSVMLTGQRMAELDFIAERSSRLTELITVRYEPPD